MTVCTVLDVRISSMWEDRVGGRAFGLTCLYSPLSHDKVGVFSLMWCCCAV